MDVAHLLISLAGLGEPTTKNVLLGLLDMRSKLHACLALGFKMKRSETWYAELSETLNKIDNSTRNERNRIIHDFWSTIPDKDGKDVITRVRLSAKIKNTPPSGKPQLHLAEFKPITPADIKSLCDEIIEANITINRLLREFEQGSFHDKLPQLNRLQNPTGDQIA